MDNMTALLMYYVSDPLIYFRVEFIFVCVYYYFYIIVLDLSNYSDGCVAFWLRVESPANLPNQSVLTNSPADNISDLSLQGHTTRAQQAVFQRDNIAQI